MAEQLTGTLVADRYRLDRLLGEGGMGFVWSATHEITGGRVALKFLKAANVPRAEARKRFLREARASALVDHPNIVQIRDVIEHEEMPVLVMDLLQGETLASRIQRLGRLDLDDAARIGLQIIAAVGAAHAAGLVHRDLKPENVFLARVPGTGEVVRILDFGIAKLTDEGGEGTTVTQSGALMGTPAYMAPEQLFGEREIDHRVDVWAFGVILFEALAGVRPVEGENYGQLAKKLLSAVIIPIRELRPELPDPVVQLLDHLLAQNPGDRCADLHEAAEVLAPFARARPPSFGPPKARGTSERNPESGGGRLFDPGPRAFDPSGSTLVQGVGPNFATTAATPVSPRATSRTVRRALGAGQRLGVVALGLLVVTAVALGLRSLLAGDAAARGSTAASIAQAPPPSAAPTSLASVRALAYVAAPGPSSDLRPSAPAASARTDVVPEHLGSATGRAAASSSRARPSSAASAIGAASAPPSATATFVEPPALAPTTSGGLVTKPPF